MGKAKKRSLHLGINDRVSNMSRETAVRAVVDMLGVEMTKSMRWLRFSGLPRRSFWRPERLMKVLWA